MAGVGYHRRSGVQRVETRAPTDAPARMLERVVPACARSLHLKSNLALPDPRDTSNAGHLTTVYLRSAIKGFGVTDLLGGLASVGRGLKMTLHHSPLARSDPPARAACPKRAAAPACPRLPGFGFTV